MQTQDSKLYTFHLKRVCRIPAQERSPREFFPWDLSYHAHPCKHSEAVASMAKESIAQAASTPKHHPCGAGFSGMQNARVLGSQSLPLVFQRKAWEARQGVLTGQCTKLWEWSQRSNRDSGKLQMTGTWNVYWGRLKAVNEVSIRQKPCGFQLARPSSWGQPRLLDKYHLITTCPGCWTWRCKI